MATPGTKVIGIPYYSQRQSATSEAFRMCFSASMAMCCEYLKPGCIKGKWPLLEDDYLQAVHAYGDTTDANAQIKTAASLGVKAIYHQNGDWEKVKELLAKGKPVPVGFDHHGPLNAPYGGHWVVCIGVEAGTNSMIFQDPYGIDDMDSGVYVSTNGEHVRYDMTKFGKRWMVEGRGTGWYVEFL